MKILYVCADLGIPTLGRHGAGVHVRSLVAAFRRDGHSVLLAAPLLNKSPWEEAAPIAAPVLHLPPGAATNLTVLALKSFNRVLGASNPLPSDVRRILYNRDLLRQLKGRFTHDPPDFIYERVSLYATAGVQLARALDRPLVVELNAPIALEQAAYRNTSLGALAAQAERWMLSQADLVVVVSSTLRDYVQELGVDRERVQVIPNGVDTALFQPRGSLHGNGQPWHDGSGPVLGFVGGLRPWHGVDKLPALLARLAPHYAGLHLIIAGDGPLRGDLERDLQQRGLERRVTFTGALPHEEVADLIGRFDVALAPYSRPEHPFYFSPLKLFEYMACGVPVVAARLGQIAEVVRDGETGLLYSPDELEELAAACDRLLGEPALRRRLGQAAADEVHRHYTWDRNAARIVELAHSFVPPAVEARVC